MQIQANNEALTHKSQLTDKLPTNIESRTSTLTPNSVQERAFQIKQTETDIRKELDGI